MRKDGKTGRKQINTVFVSENYKISEVVFVFDVTRIKF